MINLCQFIISSSSPELCWTTSPTISSCSITARHAPEQQSPWRHTSQSPQRSRKWSDRPSRGGRAAALQETSPYHHISAGPQRTAPRWSWTRPGSWCCSLAVTNYCRGAGWGWAGRGTPIGKAWTRCHVTPGWDGWRSPVLPPGARWEDGPDLTFAPLT